MNKNDKCSFYIDKLDSNNELFNQIVDERKLKQIGLLYLKLANNYKTSDNTNYYDYEKIIHFYKKAADIFQKYDNNEDDIRLYVQILITIVHLLNVYKSIQDNLYIDKIMSICKILDDDHLKGKFKCCFFLFCVYNISLLFCYFNNS